MSDKKTLKIFHCADLHLDSPFSGLDVAHSEAARRALRGTFTSMMLYARTNKFDIVLLSGDLFDDGYAGDETVSIMMSEFESAPDIKFVISPGNHDPYTASGVYASKKFPENVYVFTEDKLSRFSFDDIGVDVYGWAFTSDTLESSPIIGTSVRDSDRINLLCAHCDTASPISKYCPVSESDIAAFGCDYAAFGHIHRRSEPKLSGKCTWAYSGCPSGRSFDEPGVGGAYLVEISLDGERSVNWSFRPFSHCRYESEILNVSGARSQDELYSAIRDMIAEKKYDKETALRVTLEGATAAFESDIDALEKSFDGLFYIDIRDNTLPIYDSEYLEKDMTLRGELYRTLLPQMTSGTPSERRIAAMALRLGLAALSGADITEG